MELFLALLALTVFLAAQFDKPLIAAGLFLVVSAIGFASL